MNPIYINVNYSDKISDILSCLRATTQRMTVATECLLLSNTVDILWVQLRMHIYDCSTIERMLLDLANKFH